MIKWMPSSAAWGKTSQDNNTVYLTLCNVLILQLRTSATLKEKILSLHLLSNPRPRGSLMPSCICFAFIWSTFSSIKFPVVSFFQLEVLGRELDEERGGVRVEADHHQRKTEKVGRFRPLWLCFSAALYHHFLPL